MLNKERVESIEHWSKMSVSHRMWRQEKFKAIWLICTCAFIDSLRSSSKKQTKMKPLQTWLQTWVHCDCYNLQALAGRPFIRPPPPRLDRHQLEALGSHWFFLANTAAECWLHSSPILTGLLAPPDWCHPRYKWLLDWRWSKRYHVPKESQSSMQALLRCRHRGDQERKMSCGDELNLIWKRIAVVQVLHPVQNE